MQHQVSELCLCLLQLGSELLAGHIAPELWGSPVLLFMVVVPPGQDPPTGIPPGRSQGVLLVWGEALGAPVAQGLQATHPSGCRRGEQAREGGGRIRPLTISFFPFSGAYLLCSRGEGVYFILALTFLDICLKCFQIYYNNNNNMLILFVQSTLVVSVSIMALHCYTCQKTATLRLEL